MAWIGGVRVQLFPFAVLSAAVLTFGTGCSLVLGDRVEVIHDDVAVDAAFRQVRESTEPARLGDVIAGANLPLDAWDRMYRFPASKDGGELNDALGTDVHWVGLPGGSDGYVQIFMNRGDVVYAFADNVPSSGVRDGYATPDSMVRPVERERGVPSGEGTEVYWGLEIDEFDG